ncbi:MAG: hypothetical protein HC923_11330 [Myxococcales bacterium]|nr:hypothetical protein [Myxococcales bacterium]
MRDALRPITLLLGAVTFGCEDLLEVSAGTDVVTLTPKDGESGLEVRIDARELRQALARRRLQVVGDLDAPPLPRPVQESVLEELIEEAIMEDEARRLGLVVSSSVVQAELRTVVGDLPPNEYRQYLTQTYQTEKHLEDNLRKRLLAQRLLAREPSRRRALWRSAALGRRSRRTKKVEAPRVRASQIVVATEQAALDVRKRLLAGEPSTRSRPR